MLNYSPLNAAALNAYGAVVITAEAVCSASASLSSNPERQAKSFADVTASGTVSSVGVADRRVNGTLRPRATAWNASGLTGVHAIVPRPSSSYVKARATVRAVPNAVIAKGSYSGLGILSGEATRMRLVWGSSACEATVNGDLFHRIQARGSIRANGSLQGVPKFQYSGDGFYTHPAHAAPAVTATVTAVGLRECKDSPTITVSSDLSGLSTPNRAAYATSTCSCTIIATGDETIVKARPLDISCSSTLSGNATNLKMSTSSVSCSAEVTAAVYSFVESTVVFSGSATMSGDAGQISLVFGDISAEAGVLPTAYAIDFATAEVTCSTDIIATLRANAHLFAPAYRRYYLGPEDRDIETAYENRTIRVA